MSGERRWIGGPRALLIGLLGLALLVTGLGPATAGSGEPPSDAPPSFAGAVEGRDFVPGELLVRYEPGTRAATRSSKRRRHGLRRLEGLPLPRLERVEVQQGESVLEKAAELSADPSVRYAEPNYIVRPLEFPPNDPQFNQLWGLDNTGQGGGTPGADINVRDGWPLAADTSNIVVGVIDTGIDIDHPDLEEQIWTNPGEVEDGDDTDGNGFVDDVNGWNFVNDTPVVFDSARPSADEHGTHVAGTIAATMNNNIDVTGVSQAQIMPLKFIGRSGGGTIANAIRAIDYAIDNGAHITNNSWGGGGFSQSLQNAIGRADDAEQLFVAAAGNDGRDRASYPARFPNENIISVAATTRTDALASFSNYSVTQVDLGAPGHQIRSTVPGSPSTAVFSGTSMAAPHATGAAVHVMARFPSLTHLEVKEQVMDTGDPISALAGKTVSGNRLNLAAALDTNPIAPTVEIQSPTELTLMSGREAPLVAGSASDDEGVTDVVVAIRNGAGRYWNGNTFGTTEAWFPAQIDPAGAPEVDWSFTWPSAAKADAETFTILVRARDAAGNRTDPPVGTEIILDNVAPKNVTTRAGKRYQRQRRFPVSWSAEDNGGVESFLVQRRAARFNGGWGSWATWQETSATSTTGVSEDSASFRGGPGRTYCFRTRAWDQAGNSRRGSAGCTAVPLNNTHLAHQRSWRKRSGIKGAYLGTFSRSTQRRARLVRRGVQAKRLAIVVTRCPRCGTVAIRWRGKLLRRINLRAPTTRRRQVIGIKSFPGVRKGTLAVVVTSRGRPVIVEGLGVSRV